MPTNLILASSSRYRKKLLERLMLPFDCIAPEIDETPYEQEAIATYIKRITLAKASAVASQTSSPAIIIASDQSATCNGAIIGKPHTQNRAIEQLMGVSGQTVEFLTGVCVHNTATANTDYQLCRFQVTFRRLEREEVKRYVEKEMPLDCAGSFKCEGLGIALFEAMEGQDPTALEGLPLIATCQLLKAAGLDPLS